MVCVVGRMRDLILQLSKSSIYSTKPPGGYRKVDNIKNAYTCETHRESRFFTLTTEEDWYPDSYPNILEAPCQAIKDPQAMTEYTRDHARWFPITF